MKKIKSFLVVFFLVVGHILIFAQVDENTVNDTYGIETSPIFPLAKIYAIQCTYSVWSIGDLIFGYAYQNEIIKDEGQCHGHTLLIGYRQYFWKGLHLDIEFFPAINNFYSFVDKKYYNGFEVVAEIRPGYRFDFKISERLYVYFLIQGAMLFGIHRDNPWPNMSKEPFFFPILWCGISK